MNLSRRRWLCEVAGPTAVLTACGGGHRTAAAAGRVPERTPISELQGDPLRLFTEVYSAWRCLRPTHPWSIQNHAAIHRDWCSEAAHMGMNLHRTWDFLPWHRCFMHFHEQVLIRVATAANVRGAENFTLPYWDWEVVHSVPKIYMDPQSPVYLDRGDGDPQLERWTKPEHIASLLAPLTFEGPCGLGGAQDTAGVANGSIPHIKIHTSVSSEMSVPETAALDPLFYIHHSNMDRFWEIWARTPYGQAASYSQALRDTVYSFPGHAPGRDITYRVGDVLKTEQLRYTYASYEPGVKCERPHLMLESRSRAGLVEFSKRSAQALRELTAAALKDGQQMPVVFLRIVNEPLPYNRDGYRVFLQSAGRVPLTLEAGEAPMFEARNSRVVGMNTTLPMRAEDLLQLGRGFRMYYRPVEGNAAGRAFSATTPVCMSACTLSVARRGR